MIPIYQSFKVPSDIDERKGMLEQHNQDEIIARNIDSKRWYRGVLFYPLRGDNSRYAIVYGSGKDSFAVKCSVGALEEIMIRMDEKGKRQRTARLFAIQKKRGE